MRSLEELEMKKKMSYYSLRNLETIGERKYYTNIYDAELNRQSMSDAGCSMLGAGAWG